MQFIFKDQITDKLLFVIQRFELALKRTSDVADCDDLLRTPEGVDLFDATCMRIQTIGEALKQIDTETKEKLLVYYPGIPCIIRKTTRTNFQNEAVRYFYSLPKRSGSFWYKLQGTVSKLPCPCA